MSRSRRFFGWLRSRSRAALVIVVIAAVLLLAARAALPSFLKRSINARLDRIPGYTGHVSDVGVQLWHGGYSMYNLVIVKRGGKAAEPFISSQEIDFSIAYRQLLHGRFVSDISIEKGSLNFILGPTAETSELEADRRWQDVIKDLFPIDITDFEVYDSQVHYVDKQSKPPVDIAITQLRLRATGLKNRASTKGDPFPARVTLEGVAFNHGRLKLFAMAEPLAQQPHFKLSVELEGVSIPDLNDFLLAYANVDVGAGIFNGYLEMSAENGNFQGYAKPFLKDLKFKTAKDDEKNLWQQLWKKIVAATTQVIKNKSENQIATLMPFSGTFKQQTSVQFWHTIGNLLKNGFIRALRKGLEGSPSVKNEKQG